MKVKTIDIQAKEWFDKVNGNTYFSGVITVNLGMKNEKTLKMPFQYGYGSQYYHQAISQLRENKILTTPYDWYSPEQFKQNGIVVRYNKEERALKKAVINFGN